MNTIKFGLVFLLYGLVNSISVQNRSSAEGRNFDWSGIENFSSADAEGRNFGATSLLNQQLNSVCLTQTNNGNGICLKRAECLRVAGIASGFCGTYGVCCDFNLQCGAISRLKRTIIRNPVPVPQSCTYHFQPYSPNVCQLRIDFTMILAQPTIPTAANNLQYVQCVTDVFQVGNLRLCGSNTNQNIYIPFDIVNGVGDLTLTFTLANSALTPTVAATWNMVVTQVECPPLNRNVNQFNSFFGNVPQLNLRLNRALGKFSNIDTDLIAPNGCLQYFIDPVGTFESFNFNGGLGPYPGDLNYAICFRRTPQDSQILFTAATFAIGAISNANQYIDSDCHDLFGGAGIGDDYLLISESLLATTPQAFGTYYCGTSLQGTSLLYTAPGPFVVIFNSDRLYGATPPEQAFRIGYAIS